MANGAASADPIHAFISRVGSKRWAARMSEIQREAASSQRVGRALVNKHVIEVTIERRNRAGFEAPITPSDRCVIALAREAVTVDQSLSAAGRARFRESLAAAMVNDATLVPVFHLLRTAALQRSRGFHVHFAGLEDNASFDLLLTRDGAEAEVVCDVVSAEDGRDVHRGAWAQLVDRIDADLQTWLESHPGRYLLKLTLPQGLTGDQVRLAALHDRIRDMLQSSRRVDHDEACVLRLDPLMLAASQASSPTTPRGSSDLVPSLRREFGHEAHLAVTQAGSGLFVLAARAGREDEVAVAIRRRMAAIAPSHLTGTRPGILAMFVEDTDRTEWRQLRDRLELEGEARQFLTHPEAKGVVAVTCASRLELLGHTAPHAAPDGELRFRNPAHPAAKAPALAPAVLSSM
jgi:hypothetical protein